MAQGSGVWHRGVGCSSKEWGAVVRSGVWHRGVGCSSKEWGVA